MDMSQLVENAGLLNLGSDRFEEVPSNANYNCDCYSCQCDGGCDCVCQGSCDAGPCYG